MYSVVVIEEFFSCQAGFSPQGDYLFDDGHLGYVWVMGLWDMYFLGRVV